MEIGDGVVDREEALKMSRGFEPPSCISPYTEFREIAYHAP